MTTFKLHNRVNRTFPSNEKKIQSSPGIRRMEVSYCMKIANVEPIYLRFGEIKEQADSGQDALIVKVNADPGMTGNWRGGCGPRFQS